MKQLPTSWTSIVVGNIIDIHPDAWKDRCQDIHGIHTGNKEYSSNKDDLLAIVKVYYEQSYLLSYQDKKYFGRDIALFRMMNEQSIQSWIIVVKKTDYFKLDFSSSLYMPHAMETQRSNSSSGH